MKKYLTLFFFNEHRERILKTAAVTIIVIVAIFVFLFKTGKDNEPNFEAIAHAGNEATEKTSTSQMVIADVSGAVNSPKVVELKGDSRIGDAIEAAGGLCEDADISQINRAAIVNDGEKIYVPTKTEIAEGNPHGGEINRATNGSTKSSKKINLNKASSAELETINGVGPATAQRIINYRNTNGPFVQVDDLKNVEGIGDKTFEKMKENITI